MVGADRNRLGQMVILDIIRDSGGGYILSLIMQ